MPWSSEKFLYFALFLLLSSNAKAQLIGGIRAEEGALKFLVKLEASYGPENEERVTHIITCAGTILEKRLKWVLTNAHCFRDMEKTVEGVQTTISYKSVRVIAGVKDTDNETNRQIREVRRSDGRIFLHPQSERWPNDAALIKLHRAVGHGRPRPAQRRTDACRLQRSDTRARSGLRVSVVGKQQVRRRRRRMEVRVRSEQLGEAGPRLAHRARRAF